MSHAFYNTGQLRFWDEREIALRNGFVDRLYHAVSRPLLDLNRAWRFERVEGPIMTPVSAIPKEYEADALWILESPGFGGERAVLRAETTWSSYLFAKQYIGAGVRPPLCVWQVGKSFRRESGDGATASKLRFFEFHQVEFQCVFADGTKADYAEPTIKSLAAEIEAMVGRETKIVDSERVPSYSERTVDVEALLDKNMWDWREMASVSLRKDFPISGMKVLEVAVGLDRLVCVATRDIKKGS